MHIQTLTLPAANLAELHHFYVQILGFTCIEQNQHQFCLQCGKSQLTFAHDNEHHQPEVAHFAFNIPSAHFRQVVDWLRPRIKLLALHEQTEFFSKDWNAHMVYAYDPAGNIIEFIARHTLPDEASNAEQTDAIFNTAMFVTCISEIGIAVQDVLAIAQAWGQRWHTQPYGETDATFCPIGNEHGLIILVPFNRIWFPNTGIPAQAVRLVAQIDHYQLSGPPYTIYPSQL